MKEYIKKILIVFLILGGLTLFTSIYLFTIKATWFQIQTRMAVDIQEVPIEEIVLPEVEFSNKQSYSHGPFTFNLPFVPNKTEAKHEYASRYTSASGGLMMFFSSTSIKVGFESEQYCKEHNEPLSCMAHVEKMNNIGSYQYDYEEYIKILRTTEKDLSIFDNRFEKIYESVRLLNKSILFSRSGLVKIITFNTEDIDGIIYVSEDFFETELFINDGKNHTIVSKGVTQDELLQTISSIEVKL